MPQSRDPRGVGYRGAPSIPSATVTRRLHPRLIRSRLYSHATGGASTLPRLGPAQGNSVSAVRAGLDEARGDAWPVRSFSALDRWLADSVQPAAMRWFGVRVVEIKQISAYSCRGMNGNPHAHISEHAFGNALDIAAFTLADGRRITVRTAGAACRKSRAFCATCRRTACQQFNTVLAPGSNSHHEDHIHVDLMRRASGRTICQPAAASGDEIASRAGQRNAVCVTRFLCDGIVQRQEISVALVQGNSKVNEEDEFEDPLIACRCGLQSTRIKLRSARGFAAASRSAAVLGSATYVRSRSSDGRWLVPIRAASSACDNPARTAP